MYISKSTRLHQEGRAPYISYPLLEKTGMVRHGFSTRLGGVSSGQFASMNLSFKQGDDPEKVLENFRIMADTLGFDLEKAVMSDQTHTTNVRLMTAEDMGKGILKKKTYQDVDGMITNVPGLVLVTSYADCVPLFFVDPVHKAIGLSHSGWRGTVGRMGEVTVKAMTRAFGSRPEDLIAAVGPSICKECYEISEDVADAFKAAFSAEVCGKILTEKGGGKFQLDLWEANRQILLSAGILPDHIAVTDICTRCHSDLLWSHRATGGKRGGLAAFLSLLP